MQRKNLRVEPVPLRVEGYDSSSTYSLIFAHAPMREVGNVIYMFHLGEGAPPGVL